MKICTALELLAKQTWSLLATCNKQAISVTEDVITTNNLVFLRNNVPKAFVAWDARPWEYFIGCDFEMWIGSQASGWCGYAVQAKRMQMNTGKYLGLNHRNSYGRQIDLLEAYAANVGVEPIYLFYNTLTPHLPSLCGSPYPLDQLGCTITPSNVVAAALSTHGAKNFSWIHAHSDTALWRCLTCCNAKRSCYSKAVGSGTKKQLPDHVQQTMRSDLQPKDMYDRYEHRLRAKALVVIEVSDDIS